jgi:hypothetical protein
MKILSLLSVAALFLTPVAPFTPTALQKQTKVGPKAQIRHVKTSLNSAPPSEKDLERFESYGESSRKFRRSYWTHADWVSDLPY